MSIGAEQPYVGRKQVLVVLAIYASLAMAYFFCLRMSSGKFWDNYYTWQALIDYLLKGIVTLPIWWLIFVRLSHWNLWPKVILNIALAPVFVKVWQLLYYYVCGSLGFGSLQGGTGEWWDIYIPFLFYVLQFGFFHAYDYYYHFQKEKAHANALKETALQNELRALKAQINPHFLYNAFNAISASVPPGAEKTRELIASLADMFRYQLRAYKADRVSLGEELDFIRQYLRLAKARFDDRLIINIEVPKSLMSVPIAPMLLQPLVENAVQHGISPKLDGGELSIEVEESHDGLIHFCVADTGIGLQENSKTKGTGVGLVNTRRRLALLYQTELVLSPNKPSGIKVEFAIPRNHVTESAIDRRRGPSQTIIAGIPG